MLCTVQYNLQSVSLKHLHALCLLERKDECINAPKAKMKRGSMFQTLHCLWLSSGGSNPKSICYYQFNIIYFPTSNFHLWILNLYTKHQLVYNTNTRDWNFMVSWKCTPKSITGNVSFIKVYMYIHNIQSVNNQDQYFKVLTFHDIFPLF